MASSKFRTNFVSAAFSVGWFSQELERQEAFSFIILKAAAPLTFFFFFNS